MKSQSSDINNAKKTKLTKRQPETLRKAQDNAEIGGDNQNIKRNLSI